MIEYKQNNYRLTTSVSIFARFPIMKLQMKSQITSIVNRVIAEMTVVLGRLVPVTGIMPFKPFIMVCLKRAMGAVILVYLIFQSEKLERLG